VVGETPRSKLRGRSGTTGVCPVGHVRGGCAPVLLRIGFDDPGVALKERELHALHRGAAELCAVRFFGPLQHVAHVQRSGGKARLQRGVGCLRSAAIERTDILADVAAVEPVADGRVKLVGDVAAMLDGQIGNASAGVELVRGGQGL